MRSALKACAVVVLVSVCCVVLTSCVSSSSSSLYDVRFARATPEPAGPSGVEFVGVYEERAELIPGLRSANTVRDLARMLQESNKPGGTNVRATFRVLKVLSDKGGCLESGDRLCLIFPSPKSAREPSPLPDRFVSHTLRIRLHDGFRPRYCGRFTYVEWRGAAGSPSRYAAAP